MPERAARVAVAFHSARGHTAALADAVVEGAREAGAEVTRVAVDHAADWAAADWQALHDADAIVFGSPTHMGSASAPFKAFMDASSRHAWVGRRWRDKLAAGFAHSSGLDGDRQGVLVQLATFAAQHGMLWVSLDALPGAGDDAELNRLGSSLGATARSRRGERTPPAGDLATARHLGARVARAAARWVGGPSKTTAAPAPTAGGPSRHPATQRWRFPDPQRAPLPLPLRRANLKELAARPGRFEHHLMVVGTLGDAQIEIATASEPVYFAHRNISDEYAVAMPTGDALVDGFPMRTFLVDDAHQAIARYQHQAGDLVLHPFGPRHWPGQLRPPHEPFVFAPGTRRTGYTLVFCARRPLEPTTRPLRVDREGGAKSYVDDAPDMALFDLREGEPGRVARVGNVRVDLVASPAELVLAEGGWVAVIVGDGVHASGDLIFVPPGASVPTGGLVRALVFTSTRAPDPPPASWDEVPAEPFPPAEAKAPGKLPLEVEREGVTLHVEPESATHVRLRVTGGEGEEVEAVVPRYWMARMLYRLPLHGLQLGRLETYGGFTYEDHAGDRDAATDVIELGVGERRIAIPRDEAAHVIEQLYRAVAPEGYVERLS